MQRIADQIKRELAELLTSKVNDPRFHTLSITGVDVSPDMANALVFVSQLEESEIKTTLAALNKAAGFFRFHIAHNLNLRVTPRLRFVFDESISRGSRISSLIDRIPIKKSEDSARDED